MPAAAAELESVRVTVAILALALDTGNEALGACRGRSPETVFVCSAVALSDSSSWSRWAYSVPSWPTEGRLTLGGRSGTSVMGRKLLLSDEGTALLWEEKQASFSGERAKESLLGETDRSTLRLGRGGIRGMSMLAEVEVGWERTGRWGTVGVAMIAGQLLWGWQQN
jgi:hypothetical protein